MSGFETALAGAVTAVGVGAIVIARSWPIPTGRHRAPRPLMRPVEAMDKTAALCAKGGWSTSRCRSSAKA